MQSNISFHEQISRNKRNSIFLIIFIFAILIGLSYVIGAIYSEFFFVILIFGIIISITYILVGYYKSDKIALASVKAKPASESEYRQIHHIVEGLCLASGMPKPKIYIMEGEQINAFATGRDPKHSVICLTKGAVKKLNKQELEGVIGHELSHIANYDIRFMTLTAVLVGMIAIISEIFLRSLWFSGGRNNDNKGGMILIIIGIVFAILAPIVVFLVQMAISRKREYAADASSVKFIRSPTGLIGALKKIKTEHQPMKVSGAVSPLFISDPFKKKMSGLTQTHPPIDERIKVLERM
ncbi:MAG: M48 family metallopeptidase [Nanoarchaeota archaeon]|nr:M48 family metallopeptidase [Nanoarchaeota archaeon]